MSMSAAIILAIVIGILSLVLGLAYGGAFEKKWDRTIHLLMSAEKSPFRSIEGPYPAGAIVLKSREYVQGFRLPCTRSGKMPIVKSVLLQYSEPGRRSVPIGIVSMDEGYAYVDCMFSENIQLSTESGSSLMITIWNPIGHKTVTFVAHPPNGVSDIG